MAQAFNLRNHHDTERAAKCFAEVLQPGDTVLLQGPVGAGKTDFARNLIQARQSEFGAVEDVPSPTFTLVQVYTVGNTEIWHADLFRLSDPDEIFELGLEAAIEDAICLIEWPERMGSLAPKNALWLRFDITEDGSRILNLEWQAAKWNSVPDMLAMTLSPHQDS